MRVIQKKWIGILLAFLIGIQVFGVTYSPVWGASNDISTPDAGNNTETISNQSIPLPPEIRMTKSAITLNKKKSRKLGYSLKRASSSDLVWTSSNKKVASVSSKGKVKARKIGKAIITARIRGTNISASCYVTVVHYKKYKVRATGYCNCAACSGPGNPRTASGTRPKEGRTIAVDKRRIPFGTKVEIKGHIYRAEDTGGAIKGKRIDIYFRSHRKATSFGVKYLTIKVYLKK